MSANREMNIKTLIRHSIDLMRVFLVMRTGILGKNLFQYFNLFCIQSLQTQMPVYIFRNLYIKFLPFAVINKTAPCPRMRIGIHHIRLDVKYRCFVHKISSLNMNDRTMRSLPFDMRNFYR